MQDRNSGESWGRGTEACRASVYGGRWCGDRERRVKEGRVCPHPRKPSQHRKLCTGPKGLRAPTHRFPDSDGDWRGGSSGSGSFLKE